MTTLMEHRDVYLNYIQGEWKQGSTSQWSENRNPAKPTDLIGKITCSSGLDLERAVQAAETAQVSWKKTPRPQRGALIYKAAQILRAKLETLAKALTREEGKNLNEARGETLKAIQSMEFTATESRRPIGEALASEIPNTLLYTNRTALGVVGLITPWNFPICIPAWKTAPALLEGNAVILKPSTLTPATATWMVRAYEEAGLPAGLLNLLHGSGAAIGNAMVEHPRIRAISFTGSNSVGKELYARAAKLMKRVQLEMGGKNPLIVLEDADLDLAVDATLLGAFGSTGQRCTATSRVLVEQSIRDIFTAKLVERARSIKVGDGLLDPQAMGPLVDPVQFKSVLDYIEMGKAEGARLLCGGERIGVDPAESGYFVTPTIFDEVKPEMRLAREEIFGPVLSILSVSSFEEAVSIANQVEFGLSSSLYTTNIQRVMQFIEQSEVGIVHINSPTVGGEVHAPFGGMKATGLGGREMGRTGPEFFCEIKTVYMDYNTTTRKGNLY
jgi:alpha-ketoglutaric semialdehyde dehydrogenase